jgi:hypothetical protein
MDHIIKLAKIISEKFILCEMGNANKELDNLSQLLLQHPDLLREPHLLTILEELVKAQELKDHLYIADLLSYRLIPALLK